MIAKKMKQSATIKKSKAAHGSDLIRYVLTARKEDAENTEKLLCGGCVNMLTNDTKNVDAVIAEQLALAYESKRSNNPFLHYVLSVEQSDNEKINATSAAQIARTFMRELGVSENTCVYGVHDDRDNRHIHIVINKIHPTKLRSIEIERGFDIKAAHRAAAIISKEHGLAHVQNALYVVNDQGEAMRNPDYVRGVSDLGRQAEQQTGECSNERICRAQKDAMLNAKTWAEVHTALAENGVQYIKLKAGGAKIKRGNFFMKASSVARECSLKYMQDRLGPFEPPRKQALEKANKTEKEQVRYVNLAPFSALAKFGLLGVLLMLLLRLFVGQRNVCRAKYKAQVADIKNKNWDGKHTQRAAVLKAATQEHKAEMDKMKSDYNELARATKERYKNAKDNKALQLEICDKIIALGDDVEKAAAIKFKTETLKIIDKNTILHDKAELEKRHSILAKAMQVLGAERYAVYAKVNENEGKSGTYSETLKTERGADTFSSRELEGQFTRVLGTQFERNCGIMLHPKSDTHFYIVIDDLTRENIDKMRAEHSVALAYTTSPDNYQAVIKINKLKHVDPAVQKTAAIKVARNIVEKYNGDRGGVGAERTMRMPGTNNFKHIYMEKGIQHCCSVEIAENVTCDKAKGMFYAAIQQEYQRTVQRNKEQEVQNKVQSVRRGEVTTLAPEHAVTLYEVFERDLHIKMRNLTNDDSRYYIAKRLVALGYNNEQVTEFVRAGAEHSTPGSTKLHDRRYFERIAERAREAEEAQPAPGGITRLWQSQARAAAAGKGVHEIERQQQQREQNRERE